MLSIEQIILSKSNGRYTMAKPYINDLIIQASDETGNSYGKHRNKAIALLVMHWLTLEDNSSNTTGAVGQIVGQQEYGLSITRAFSSSSNSSQGGMFDDAYLKQTQYGLELISLKRKCIFPLHSRQTLAR
jgi:hypothetical protein